MTLYKILWVGSKINMHYTQLMVQASGITFKHDGLYDCYLYILTHYRLCCYRGKVNTFNRLKGVTLSPHCDAYKPVKYDL